MPRALVIYAVNDPEGVSNHPTLAAAVKDAREAVARYRAIGDTGVADDIEVVRVTIPGPFNRDLVCRLLSNGGYASDQAVVWRGGKAVQS